MLWREHPRGRGLSASPWLSTRAMVVGRDNVSYDGTRRDSAWETRVWDDLVAAAGDVTGLHESIASHWRDGTPVETNARVSEAVIASLRIEARSSESPGPFLGTRGQSRGSVIPRTRTPLQASDSCDLLGELKSRRVHAARKASSEVEI